MKKFMKSLTIVACAVALVAVSVAGTLAWLTDQTDPITNTFTAGKVDIDLTVTPTEDKLIPGKTIEKTATVTVSNDSEECYIYIKLDNGLADVAALTVDSNWELVAGETCIYSYKEKATAGDYSASISLTVNGTANATAIAAAADNQFVVSAYAVQAESMADAQAAWAASGFATSVAP